MEERDSSRLLVYKNGVMEEDQYKNIATYIPGNSLLVFNNTRVINARIRFKKTTGSNIEIFCLEPAGAVTEYSSAMNARGEARWKCLIGGVSKWKEAFLQKPFAIGRENGILRVRIVEKLSDAYLVAFNWSLDGVSFAEILETAGDVPLPPYIKRESEKTDSNRYQTIYAKHDGSVAAPTAGLHFTEQVFASLEEKKIHRENITLHVGAGTFKPVKAATMEGHEMHAEWIDVGIGLLETLLATESLVIAVGTTSLRTIESLYWLGVKAIKNPASLQLSIGQWDVYAPQLNQGNHSAKEALSALIQWMKDRNLQRIFTQTQLLITPGYQFRIVRALVTNFHQPQSTLLLLVAAAVGDDWKRIYQYALDHQLRFLSYGDGSLLFMAES